MSDKVFHDYLGRQINVGDVLANGHRDGDRGGISIGVVTGFTDDAILATKYHRGEWYGVTGRWWSSASDGPTWRAVKGRWTHGERCFITGLTEDALKAMINLESEEKQ